MSSSDPARRVWMVGPPNAGKSTLFNAMTGAAAGTGNYAGTTVSVERGLFHTDIGEVELFDLPGARSLVAQSDDEAVTTQALVDAVRRGGDADVVVLVLDGPRLARSLYLATQVLTLGLPVVVAVNLMDEARRNGEAPDVQVLADALGVPVVGTSARSGEGVAALQGAVARMVAAPVPTPAPGLAWSDALAADLDAVAVALPDTAASGAAARRREIASWLLQADDGPALDGAAGLGGEAAREVARRVREAAASAGRDLDTELVAVRYAWIDALVDTARAGGVGSTDDLGTDRLDAVLLHPLSGTLVFLGVMWTVFTALFAWSDPLIGAVESVFSAMGEGVAGAFEAPIARAGDSAAVLEITRDLLVDGIIGGVGAVLVFLPQIALLFLLLSVLEDCGYLARAAALMDRVLRAAGLPGQAFVPLLSGFACAVPAVMATRAIPRWRDRLLTMAVLPLTSCSARLPVYTLMIGALFPATVVGWPLGVRPSALMAMYLFSTATTVVAAIVIGRTVLASAPVPALVELPPYRWPVPRNVGRTVWARSKEFVQEAGQVILVATIVLWALLAFPRYAPEEVVPPDVLTEARAAGADLDDVAAPYALEQSFAGRIGHAIEPVIAPLGFDWKVGIGLIGSFAAREVFVSTMGVVYGVVDADEASTTLRDQLRTDTGSDGERVFTPLVGLSIMVFFALAMQCLSTLAVLKKEGGGWRLPVAVTAYMTVLAYLASLAVYQGGLLLGFD